MSKFKSILFALAFSLVGCPVAHSKENNETQNVALIVADAGMSITERKVRDAAVRVFTHDGGHGSGSYIKHKDYLFVLTAQHVADGPLYSDYRVKKGDEIKSAVLVWSDKKADIAVLMLKSEFETITPMDYKITSDIPEVGRGS